MSYGMPGTMMMNSMMPMPMKSGMKMPKVKVPKMSKMMDIKSGDSKKKRR